MGDFINVIQINYFLEEWRFIILKSNINQRLLIEIDLDKPNN